MKADYYEIWTVDMMYVYIFKTRKYINTSPLFLFSKVKFSFAHTINHQCCTIKLKCIKLYLKKFSKRKSESSKMHFINIHFTINPSSFNKYCIYKFLYMIVTYCQNKTLYNKVFQYKFMALLMFSHIHRPHKIMQNR